MLSNAFEIVSFIREIGCFCVILDTFGAVRLYVITSGV